LEEESAEILFTRDCKIGRGPFKKNGRLTLTEKRILLEEDSSPIMAFGRTNQRVVMDIPIGDLENIPEKRKTFLGGCEIKMPAGERMTFLSFDSDVDSALESLRLCMDIERKKRIFRKHAERKRV
jgi:hypothetical protein